MATRVIQGTYLKELVTQSWTPGTVHVSIWIQLNLKVTDSEKNSTAVFLGSL
jgi:hypothetical protein